MSKSEAQGVPPGRPISRNHRNCRSDPLSPVWVIGSIIEDPEEIGGPGREPGSDTPLQNDTTATAMHTQLKIPFFSS